MAVTSSPVSYVVVVPNVHGSQDPRGTKVSSAVTPFLRDVPSSVSRRVPEHDDSNHWGRDPLQVSFSAVVIHFTNALALYRARAQPMALTRLFLFVTLCQWLGPWTRVFHFVTLVGAVC